MKLLSNLNVLGSLSKFLLLFCVLLFVVISFSLGFSLGIKYQNNIPQQVEKSPTSINSNPKPTSAFVLEPEPTSVPQKYITDWDIYESKRFGFSFNNPGGYVLETTYENVYPDQGYIQLHDQSTYQAIVNQTGAGEGYSLINISSYQNLNKVSPLEWAQNETAHSNYQGKYVAQKVAGQDAISYAWEGGYGGGFTVILISPSKGYIVKISNLNEPSLTFEKLIAGFTFVN